jgi:hypothetical protein
VDIVPKKSPSRSIPKMKREMKFFNPDRIEGLTEESK